MGDMAGYIEAAPAVSGTGAGAEIVSLSTATQAPVNQQLQHSQPHPFRHPHHSVQS
eukprot:NODE_6244_length_521_cov_128.271186_g5477_i0.p4 GENE.NODE_6244_length_521_cov_128.271186_g5477_i0~~NODE_6244_length_521_cov_128.271186_g5477_i0.p4  ORF type:complete len:63 (+),score=15.89 NODE_6244_length_521_cov_128.271186_g5477_i0:24-191(+)